MIVETLRICRVQILVFLLSTSFPSDRGSLLHPVWPAAAPPLAPLCSLLVEGREATTTNMIPPTTPLSPPPPPRWRAGTAASSVWNSTYGHVKKKHQQLLMTDWSVFQLHWQAILLNQQQSGMTAASSLLMVTKVTALNSGGRGGGRWWPPHPLPVW